MNARLAPRQPSTEPHRTPRGRILLLAYHFPPAQSAGALRWQKLAAYADQHGWGLDVLTRDPRALAIQDPAALQELPESLRILPVPEAPHLLARIEALARRTARAWVREPSPSTREPRQLASATGTAGMHRSSFARAEVRFHPTSARDWARAHHVVMSALEERSWALCAAEIGRAAFVPGVHALVLSCGPPHMSHEGARRLSVAQRVPLVLDLRDTWSLAERVLEPFASPLYFRLAKRFEARAVRHARLVVMNTELACRAMQREYPEAAGRILAIPNGADDGTIARSHAPGGPFRIAYAGTIYLDRNPSTLFTALARVASELDLSPRDIEVAFMGPIEGIEGQPLEALARAAGVERYVRVLPPGTRREAERLLASAHVLVNLHQDSHMAIPSKLYEYMRHEANLLVLAEPGSATHELVCGTPADLVSPGDVDAIAAALRNRYQQFRAGVEPTALAADPRFSRRRQAERLLEAIDASVAGSGVPARARAR